MEESDWSPLLFLESWEASSSSCFVNRFAFFLGDRNELLTLLITGSTYLLPIDVMFLEDSACPSGDDDICLVEPDLFCEECFGEVVPKAVLSLLVFFIDLLSF